MLAKEFFRAFSVRGGMNLHINVDYGENAHHIIESMFKSFGRALQQACRIENRVKGVRSSKGILLILPKTSERYIKLAVVFVA